MRVAWVFVCVSGETSRVSYVRALYDRRVVAQCGKWNLRKRSAFAANERQISARRVDVHLAREFWLNARSLEGPPHLSIDTLRVAR